MDQVNDLSGPIRPPLTQRLWSINAVIFVFPMRSSALKLNMYAYLHTALSTGQIVVISFRLRHTPSY
jgi:hypothetical protein